MTGEDAGALMFLGFSQAWLIAFWFARERHDSLMMLTVASLWLFASVAVTVL